MIVSMMFAANSGFSANHFSRGFFTLADEFTVKPLPW